MSARTVILASASPARLRILRDAGLDPEVVVTAVREDYVDGSDTRDIVRVLARRKAEAAASATVDALVIGCDSLLDLDGVAMGKPESPDVAAKWWRARRGNTGTLCSGHCVIDTRTGERAEDVAVTRVRFGAPSDVEIDAYVATGEPLRVAGGFTIDGYAAPFVDSIDGDAGTVLGLSMPLLRNLLARLGVEVTDLWR